MALLRFDVSDLYAEQVRSYCHRNGVTIKSLMTSLLDEKLGLESVVKDTPKIKEPIVSVPPTKKMSIEEARDRLQQRMK